jgi:peptide/nickel transport system substrate-binding protein
MLAFPSKLFSYQAWHQIIGRMPKKEKILLVFFLILGLSSAIFLIFTSCTPRSSRPAFGGIYREGVVGQPAFINPLYAVLNDTDRDIVSLLFSGLMKYDQDGNIIPDLAQEYTISDNGKVYEFTLRDNIFWHDHQPLTADDIIFTIKTIQNPACQSPLRASWFNIQTEKLSDKKVRFILSQPYPNFLETATTKIIPQHIWEKTPARSLALATSSLYSIIGSGPFQFDRIESSNGQVKALHLKANSDYYFSGKPYLSRFSFYFFPSTETLIQAAQLGRIDGFVLNPSSTFENQREFVLYKLDIPQYFAVFFNPDQAHLLAQTSIRKALNYGINRQEIIDQIFHGQAKIVDSPLLSDFYHGFSPSPSSYDYNPSKAQEILDNLGFVKTEDSDFRIKTVMQESSPVFQSDLRKESRGEEVKELQKCLAQFPDIYTSGKVTGYFGSETKEAVILFQEKYREDILKPWGFTDGTGLVSQTTRKKLNEICASPKPAQVSLLEFTITTVDQPQLKAVADLLQKQWQAIGVKVNIEVKPTSVLESTIINPRDYQALLFGETLAMKPDPFPFWHSSKRMSPGLNLALYNNPEIDNLLEETRQSADANTISKNYQEFQDILLDDAPAVFLYRPLYLYYLSSKIKINYPPTKVSDPSQRFAETENWYIKTK